MRRKIILQLVTVTCLELMERSNIVIDTQANVLVFLMLLERDVICVLHTTGKLLVEKVARLVIAMR
jgi:hypothetical protein